MSVKVLDREFEESIAVSDLQNRTRELGAQISRDLCGRDPVFLCVLNGAFVFAADLVRSVTTSCTVEFVKFASYEGTQSTGNVKKLIGLNQNLEGRTVVIVEDIVDTGRTIETLKAQVCETGAADVRIAALLFKPASCVTGQTPDYCGFEIPNDFIVGYGLDYNGCGRNLPGIYKIKQ